MKNKVDSLGRLSKFDEAIKVYEKAIEINPKDSDAWYNKGVTLDSLHKPDEAIKSYNKAIEVNPKNSMAWYKKGLALHILSSTTSINQTLI